ncbi:MAG: flagellar basal body P-ring formation chaperone FlgA [Planctomycetaceae bacterium]|nr:flagellar basal body P-ring formation chaperone FlgA [Planctomycetaceae bacterium]
MLRLAILWTLSILCVLPTLYAAEIRLKSTPIQCTEPLVTLADIADVLPMGDANRTREDLEPLRKLVLFPAPTDGQTRTLDQWEVRSMLSQLGINTLHHFVSGVDKVTIHGLAPNGIMPTSTAPSIADPVGPNAQFVIQANYLTPAGTNSVKPLDVRSAMPTSAMPSKVSDAEFADRLTEQVADALSVYLNFTNRIERSWEIALTLSPEQVNLFATSGQIAEITGGFAPFTGYQQFSIRMQTGVTISVEAVITLPTEIVVARRTLPRGYIINASDVMLQRADRVRGENFVVDINSVIGKETVKAVRELSPLSQSDVRQPLWVRKGEIVTVRAVNGGITVHTEATAMQDGVEGDTISVAKLDLTAKRGKREEPVTYLVRVCAPKTVEVFVK